MTTTRLRALLLLATLLLAAPAHAALEASETTWDGSQPPQGVFFHWYEPSFYTGFAPRSQDPSRIHIELSRGNQVRVTVVLGDAELDTYLSDLALRRKTYQEMIDRGVLVLSTNSDYERFTKALDDAGVDAAAAAHGDANARQKAVDVMTRLNPGRVFRIHMPVDKVLAAWHAQLAANPSRLDAANAILPGRVDLTELTPQQDAALTAAMSAAAGGATSKEFKTAAAAFLDAATNGHYRVAGDHVDAVEFTAIYPAGTVEGTTTYRGERLPEFGVTGIWPLIRRDNGRGRTGMVDYLSLNPGYGFITLLGYQYAGGISYNAFHNAGVRCQLNSTPFLPSAWRKTTSERNGKPYQNLWIVGRGPTSHGCTRLPSGHMSELRQIVPSEDEGMVRVKTYRNLPQCFDLFDVDGDGSAEIMGVQYYLAYKSNEHTPVRAYVSNRREPFYRWLYGDRIVMGEPGHARITQAPICRFEGKKAFEAQTIADAPLYEPAFTTEQLQFYTTKPVPFDSGPGFELNRELRKIGAGHTTDRAKLQLK
jgi:hypothetical protein